MIIKASQRAGATALAKHLLNDIENDHVTVHTLHGFVAEDVTDAFREIEALSKATKAKSYLFSVTLNPPIGQQVSEDEFAKTAQRLAKTMHLEKQPYALIIHEKEGRKHAHCVFSRIDAEHMKAIKLPFYKQRLNALSRDLYIEHGWQLPRGYEHKDSRDPRTFNLAEWQQAKRHNLNPKQIKARLQHCWQRADNKAAFEHSLNHEGYFLARGDKRGFVAVDWFGEVHSLTRALSVKTKELQMRLGYPKAYPSVEETRQKMAQAQFETLKRLRAEQARIHSAERKPLHTRKSELVAEQRIARQTLQIFHEKRQVEERDFRQSLYQKGIKGLWHFVTGRLHKLKKQHEDEYRLSLERDKDEKQQLAAFQLKEREKLQLQLDALKRRQQAEILDLGKQVSQQNQNLDFSPAICPQAHTQSFNIGQNTNPEIRL